MIILMSGEGALDLGREEWNSKQNKNEVHLGPVGAILRFFVEKITNNSKTNDYRYIDKKTLEEKARSTNIVLPGKRSDKEKGYFIKQARAFGKIAIEHQKNDNGDVVIAVLFRDSDLSHSSPPNTWKDKFDSIVKGFESAPFERGVPMVPKPTSEAWLLALFDPPNSKITNNREDAKDREALKEQLNNELGEHKIDRDNFPWLIMQQHESITMDNLNSMPSFKKFLCFLGKALR